MDILNILLEKKGVNLTAEETAAKDAYALEQIRSRRNNLLNLTDKYMLADFSITAEEKTALTTYRQALRDITNTKPELDWNSGLVTNITWPTSPFISEYDMIMSGPNLVPKE